MANATRQRVDAAVTWGLPANGTDGSAIFASMITDPTAQARGIWVPDGTYTLKSAINIVNSVDMLCSPGAQFVTAGGIVGSPLFILNPNHNYSVLTGFSPIGNLAVGSNTVVLTSATEIANLGTPSGYNVGDRVILRCSDTGAAPPFTPIAEINKILALTGSGFTLEWPMSKAITITATTLNGTISSSATSIVLTSATGLLTTGAVQVESEIVTYTGITGNTLTGCTRGVQGSGAVGIPAGLQSPISRDV